MPNVTEPRPVRRESFIGRIIGGLCRHSERRVTAGAGGRVIFVAGSLKSGSVLFLGPWRITYVEGHVCLTHGESEARIVITPHDPHRAGYRAVGTRTHLPTMAQEQVPPLVSTGQGDYARAYPPDQAEELRNQADATH
jgi:hypothetical protein